MDTYALFIIHIRNKYTIWFEFLNTLWSMRYCLWGGGQLVVKRSGRFLDLLICILDSFETIITYVVLTLKNTTVDVT